MQPPIRLLAGGSARESECARVAGWICDIIEKIDDDGLIQAVRLGVSKLCQRFPVYGALGGGLVS